MRDLTGDPGIFIRSMATRGSLGGLARATADVISVLDAAGFDRSSSKRSASARPRDIASAAHTTIVVAPGLGDEVQAIKAGVLEIADVLCGQQGRPGGGRPHGHGAPDDAGPRTGAHRASRPADGPARPRCPAPRRTAHGCRPSSRRSPRAARASKRCVTGGASRRLSARQRPTGTASRPAAAALEHILRDRLPADLLAQPADRLPALVTAIAGRTLDPYAAADALLAD